MKVPPATPPKRGKKICEELAQKKCIRVNKSGAGLEFEDHTDGIVITSIANDSPNLNSLHVGDVIVKMNKKSLSTADAGNEDKKMFVVVRLYF